MENKTPTLTIIIPAYNVEKYLDRCLRSVCEQTFTDFEIILVNDGSTDGTLSLCKVWSMRDTRIRFFDQENKGQAYIRNFGLREACASLIMFVDADDYLESDAIAVLMELKERKKVQISMGAYFSEKPDGSPDLQHRQLGDVVISGRKAYLKALYDSELQSFCWAKIFDKALFDGLSYPNGEYMEDFRLNYLVFLRAQRIAHTAKIVYHYMINPQSTLNDVARREIANLKYFEVFLERYEHARISGVLTHREFVLFHTRAIRMLIRIIWRARRPTDRPQTEREYAKTLEVLSAVCRRKVEEKDLKGLWLRARIMKVLAQIFVWF